MPYTVTLKRPDETVETFECVTRPATPARSQAFEYLRDRFMHPIP